VNPGAKLPAYKMVPPPAGGFWRVTAWREPFAPAPPPPPIGTPDANEDDAGRFDAADGSFKTLYCASKPEGAIGEKLGDFALNPAAAVRVDAFLEGEPDPEFADDELTARLSAADVQGFRWLLAHARAGHGRDLIDLWHPQTAVALFPRISGLLRQFSLRLDRRALLDERRGFTRRLATHIRRTVTLRDGEPAAAGIRFESRLPPGWECWALWEPLPLDVTAPPTSQRVGIDTPALRLAAEQLGVVLGE